MRTVRLQVTLREVVPVVRRVIDVPAAITLDELHEVLQVALGWTDSHLHQFRTDSATYAVPFEDWDEGEIDERGVRLTALPARFVYTYDFGDGWKHDVEVLGPGGEEPGCTDGEGACPPEDCGGLTATPRCSRRSPTVANPTMNRCGRGSDDRLRPFDVAATADRVRDTVGAVPASVRLLLDLATEGIKLTPGGRLPRAIVRAVQEQRPYWYPLGRPASIEEDLLPLAALHDILRHVGLLRLSKGVLRPTKAADDLQVVRRLRSWFGPRQFDTLVAERAVALVIAHGPAKSAKLAAQTLELLGNDWRRGTAPITAADVEHEFHRLGHQLRALDLIATTWPTWTAGPSARSLLPGATLLADLL